MNSGLFTIKCIYEVRPPTIKSGLTAIDTARVIRSLAGEPDVTVAISRKGVDEMLVHITGFNAFLQLIKSGEPHVYRAKDGDQSGVVPFWIKGHVDEIPSRNVVDVDTAASAAREWLEKTTGKDDEPSPDVWERC